MSGQEEAGTSSHSDLPSLSPLRSIDLGSSPTGSKWKDTAEEGQKESSNLKSRKRKWDDIMEDEDEDETMGFVGESGGSASIEAEHSSVRDFLRKVKDIQERRGK
jgi:hypothetical protein